jgi:signal transduction histidine kinase
MAPVDLVAVIRDAVTLAATQAAIQHVAVELELPVDSARVSRVPSLLQQVFINLLLNALSAMPAAGVLHVTVDKVDAEAQVRISDTGCGIPASDIEKIFDPFYTTRPVGKGTGLGLSICYSIVQQHFGVIEVESVKGEGSTFTVRLPLLRDGGVSRCAMQ